MMYRWRDGGSRKGEIDRGVERLAIERKINGKRGRQKD